MAQIYSLIEPQFYLYAITFFLGLIIISGLGFYITKFIRKESSALRFIVAIASSIVLFTSSSYLFGYLQIRWMIYLYCLISSLLLIFNRHYIISIFQDLFIQIGKIDKFTLFIASSGIIAQLSTVIGSGLKWRDGYHFYTINGYDGIMHLAFSEFMKRQFPPVQPGAVGYALTNYHYWSNLFISEMSRIFLTPVSHIYFQWIPITLSITMAIAIYQIVKIWGGGVITQRWALFLHFFAGNATYVFALIFHGELRLDTPAIDHGIFHFFNMPHAFARTIFLVGLAIFSLWLKKKNKIAAIIGILLFSTLVGFKVYFGIYVALSISILLAYQLLVSFFKKISIKNFIKTIKSHLFSIILVFSFAIISALVFFPANKSAGGISYIPMMWPKLMINASNLDWNEWWLRMQVYEEANNTRNIIIMNIILSVLFLFSVYGTRLIGLIPPPGWLKNKTKRMLTIMLIPSAILVTLVGMNSLQVSGGANVFNFFVIALMISNIFTSFWLEKITSKRNLFTTIFCLFFITISIFRPLADQVFLIKVMNENVDGLFINNSEIEAIKFLQTTDLDAVIQSHPQNKMDFHETPYISYLSGRSSYCSSQGILNSHNQPIANRQADLDRLFEASSSGELNKLMDKYQIDYIYLRKFAKENLKFDFDKKEKNRAIAYENDQVVIIQKMENHLQN